MEGLYELSVLHELCEWSKTAEWRDGTKQMFIGNDWRAYVRRFLEEREAKLVKMADDSVRAEFNNARNQKET